VRGQAAVPIPSRHHCPVAMPTNRLAPVGRTCTYGGVHCGSYATSDQNGLRLPVSQCRSTSLPRWGSPDWARIFVRDYTYRHLFFVGASRWALLFRLVLLAEMVTVGRRALLCLFLIRSSLVVNDPVLLPVCLGGTRIVCGRIAPLPIFVAA